MAKKKLYSQKQDNRGEVVLNRAIATYNQAVSNFLTSRANLLKNLFSDDRDLDKEFDYPTTVSIAQYQRMYDRSDIAERVVSIYPDECWAVEPRIVENEDTEDTEYESAVKDLVKKHSLWYYLHRADLLSGIGHFGILLIGIDDGQDLRQPAGRIDGRGMLVDSDREQELLFVRPFSETQVDIARYETDKQSPRFGLPIEYNLKFADDEDKRHGGQGLPMESATVHWTRVYHIADNRGSSEVFGKPRMRPVFNRLLDLRKLLGGSGEMYYKGAFPGYSFEVSPEFAAAAGIQSAGGEEEFKKGLRAEFKAYSDGLQRYLATVGVSAKSLAPQVADPEGHVEAQIRAICITLGVPFRQFMGSEQGELASSQDLRNWHRKCQARHYRYLSPMVVDPLFERFIQLGVLPRPENGFSSVWPDLDVSSEQDKADVADKKTTSLQKYVSGNVEEVIPPMQYLTMILGMSVEEAEIVIEAMDEHREVLQQRKKDDFKMMQELAPISGGNGQSGGAGNVPGEGKQPGGQNPRSPSSPRSRAAGGASRSTD